MESTQDTENFELMKILLNKRGGNVGHTYDSTIIELFHNSLDTINELSENLKINTVVKDGEIIICDNNNGCENLKSFLQSETKKLNLIGRKNSGLKDALMQITGGFGELEIFSKYRDNNHYIYLDMNKTMEQYNNKVKEYKEAAIIDCNQFRETFNDNIEQFTSKNNETSIKAKKNIRTLDEAYKILIDDNKNISGFKEFINNIRENTGTIIRIKINEKQTALIKDFNENIKKKLFDRITKTIFNKKFKLELNIKYDKNNYEITHNYDIIENQAINTYLGTPIFKEYSISDDTTLYLSVVSLEKAEEQKKLYNVGGTQQLRIGAISIDETILSSYVQGIICGTGTKNKQNITDIRGLLKIKTNSPVIEQLTMANKTNINASKLPSYIKDKLSQIKKDLTEIGLFVSPKHFPDKVKKEINDSNILGVIEKLEEAKKDEEEQVKAAKKKQEQHKIPKDNDIADESADKHVKKESQNKPVPVEVKSTSVETVPVEVKSTSVETVPVEVKSELVETVPVEIKPSLATDFPQAAVVSANSTSNKTELPSAAIFSASKSEAEEENNPNNDSDNKSYSKNDTIVTKEETIKKLKNMKKDVVKYGDYRNKLINLIIKLLGYDKNLDNKFKYSIQIYTTEQCIDYLIKYYGEFNTKKNDETVEGGAKIHEVYNSIETE